MFNPKRLTIARQRRQLTKKALAEMSGVSQVTLTRLENGDTDEPESETIQALADALGYPVDFFSQDECEELTTQAVSFRSLSSLTARQRDAALAIGPLAFLVDDWVTKKFELPASDLVDLRDEDPRAAATALRSHLAIGAKPIPDMIRLMEAKGVRVFSLAEKHKNVDAFSCWRNGVPYVFLNTFKSAERSRFDAAHELGHLCLHRHGVTSGARDVEREADAFASAFLIPRDDLIGQLGRVTSLNQLLDAKMRWGVSVAALARSCFDAGLVTDWHYRDLCKQMSILGYRTKEPNPRPRERSTVWKKVLEELWREKMTKAHIARELFLPTDEVASLIDGICSLTSGEVTPARAPELRLVSAR